MHSLTPAAAAAAHQPARHGPQSTLLAFLSLSWIIVPNVYYAFNGTKCLTYNLLHGLAALAVYSLFAYERVRLRWEGTKMYYSYLVATVASAGVVGATLVLGREGTRRFGSDDGKDDELMSAGVYRVVAAAAVACVVVQGTLVTRSARTVFERKVGLMRM